MRHRTHRLQAGFTLIEVVISIVLIGILTAFSATIISNNMYTAITVDSSQASLDQMRLAMSRMSKELREIKYTTNGAYSITSTLSASATSITFVRQIGGADVTVAISRSGSSSPYGVTMTYSTSTDTPVLVSGVTAFTVDFYDGSGLATTSTTDVRFVSITLSVSDATSGSTVSERTRVALRNG